MKIENNKGPNTDPCKTPLQILISSELKTFMQTVFEPNKSATTNADGFLFRFRYGLSFRMVE